MHGTIIYMNQNRKMVRATPSAASTIMKNVTPPATAPELPPGARTSVLGSGIPRIKNTFTYLKRG